MNYKETIIEYIRILKPDITIDNKVEFRVEELLDRIYIYLDTKKLPENLLRAIAKAFVEDFDRESKAEELEISSISDNGQTITFRKKSGYANSNDRIMNDLNELLTVIRNRFVQVVGKNDELNREN